MRKSSTFTTADADRLLGLGDQFLEDWGESARRHGECGHDCEERAARWERSVRWHQRPISSLFSAAGRNRWGDEFASDPIDGGDPGRMVRRNGFQSRVAIATTQGQEAGTAG